MGRHRVNAVHTIIGPARVEGTQRGHVVWVKTNKREKAQLTDANENYAAVSRTAASINAGRWVGRRMGATLRVAGNKLQILY